MDELYSSIPIEKIEALEMDAIATAAAALMVKVNQNIIVISWIMYSYCKARKICIALKPNEENCMLSEGQIMIYLVIFYPSDLYV